MAAQFLQELKRILGEVLVGHGQGIADVAGERELDLAAGDEGVGGVVELDVDAEAARQGGQRPAERAEPYGPDREPAPRWRDESARGAADGCRAESRAVPWRSPRPALRFCPPPRC